MKVIYLASGRAELNHDDVTYQDSNGQRELDGDMMDIELENYDVLIATPPCNYWSRANYRRETSEYAQKTKHLLPDIIKKFEETGKPYIVENVRNAPLFKEIYPLTTFVIIHGRHTYFTNVMFDPSGIEQTQEFTRRKGFTERLSSYTQGGDNVNQVLDLWLETIKEEKEK